MSSRATEPPVGETPLVDLEGPPVNDQRDPNGVRDARTEAEFADLVPDLEASTDQVSETGGRWRPPTLGTPRPVDPTGNVPTVGGEPESNTQWWLTPRHPLLTPTRPQAFLPSAAPIPADEAPRRRGRVWDDRRLMIAVATIVVALLAAGWAAYTARENGQAADEWQQRAVGLEEQVNGLRTLIGERSAQLNDRTRQANSLASNLRSTRAKLRRSEGDVSSLSRRQRQLANEKAQLQDQQRSLQQQASVLEGVASQYIDCKSSLIDVISDLVYDDYDGASYDLSLAKSYCGGAESALNAYVSAYS
jgi:hypothetical protein